MTIALTVYLAIAAGITAAIASTDAHADFSIWWIALFALAWPYFFLVNLALDVMDQLENPDDVE